MAFEIISLNFRKSKTKMVKKWDTFDFFVLFQIQVGIISIIVFSFSIKIFLNEFENSIIKKQTKCNSRFLCNHLKIIMRLV